jgi:hypothetical protein
MLRLSITDAPIRMGSVGRRICSRGMILFLPLDRGYENRDLPCSGLDYTDLCN